jgi:hypothetical protein
MTVSIVIIVEKLIVVCALAILLLSPQKPRLVEVLLRVPLDALLLPTFDESLFEGLLHCLCEAPIPF